MINTKVINREERKSKSAVLIRSDAEVCTFFFSRQRQVDLIIGSDLADQLVLEYLKSGTESDDDAGTYRVHLPAYRCSRGLLPDGRPEAGQRGCSVLFPNFMVQEFVYLSDILCLRWDP